MPNRWYGVSAWRPRTMHEYKLEVPSCLAPMASSSCNRTVAWRRCRSGASRANSEKSALTIRWDSARGRNLFRGLNRLPDRAPRRVR
jgi:hypothetical protein